MRAIAPLLMSAYLLVSPAHAADTPLVFDDAGQERRYHALLEELRCLVCQNQSLEDSHAELAQDLRMEVHDMLTSGRSDAEILEFMVQRYGDFVLYRPPLQGNTWLLWFGPFLLLVIAVMVAARHARSRRAVDAAPLTDAESAQVRRMLGGAPRERGS